MSNIKCGTRTAYSYYGCRCDKCKEANRIAMAAYRKNNPSAARRHALIQGRTRDAVVRWMLDNAPDEYARIHAEAVRSVEVDA